MKIQQTRENSLTVIQKQIYEYLRLDQYKITDINKSILQALQISNEIRCNQICQLILFELNNDLQVLYDSQAKRFTRSIKKLDQANCEKIFTLIWCRSSRGVEGLDKICQFFRNRYGRRFWNKAIKGDILDSRAYINPNTVQNENINTKAIVSDNSVKKEKLGLQVYSTLGQYMQDFKLKLNIPEVLIKKWEGLNEEFNKSRQKTFFGRDSRSKTKTGQSNIGQNDNISFGYSQTKTLTDSDVQYSDKKMNLETQRNTSESTSELQILPLSSENSNSYPAQQDILNDQANGQSKL